MPQPRHSTRCAGRFFHWGQQLESHAATRIALKSRPARKQQTGHRVGHGRPCPSPHILSARSAALCRVRPDLAPVEVSGKAVGDVKVVRNMHERKAAMAAASDAFIALPGARRRVLWWPPGGATPHPQRNAMEHRHKSAEPQTRRRAALSQARSLARLGARHPSHRPPPPHPKRHPPGGFGTLEELLEMVSWQQLGFSAKPVGLLNIEGAPRSFRPPAGLPCALCRCAASCVRRAL